MIKEYVKFIKDLRLSRGIAQAEMAQHLGISRSSYIALEQGKRELMFSEAEKLSGLFGVSLKAMETGIVPDYKKYKQMILAFIKTASSADGRIPKTKLAKMLYLADFGWFYEHLESMSGMQYRKLTYGPVPDSYFRAVDELFEEGLISIETKGEAMLISTTRAVGIADTDQLSTEEKTLIKDISKKWKDKRTSEIVAFTHSQMPYSLCRDSEIIPYELITQEDHDRVY